MKTLEFKVAAGVGDNIVLRMALDTVKHNYDQIKISHNKQIVDTHRGGNSEYYKFLDDIGNLLFTEHPYSYDHNEYPEIYTYKAYIDLGIKIKSPKLEYLLCKGNSLNLGEEYIVLTTRARTIFKNSITQEFWDTIKVLSKKYKIVVIGERRIEDYNKNAAGTGDEIFSIYDQIVANIDIITDLTTSGFGITVPKLSKIQQDCLIMKEAKFVITFGIGGNVWMAAAVANTIGYRTDNEEITDVVINPEFSNIFITKNWSQFINKLKNG